MRILHINSVCGIGSTGRICTDLAAALEQQGHEVKIAYGRSGQISEQFKRISYRIGSNFDTNIHAMLSRVFDNQGFASTHATKSFLRWVDSFHPDIFHLHNLHGYYLNLPLLFDYIKETGKPIVWTLHDCWPVTGHCAYFEYSGCDKWISGCEKCLQKHEYPTSFVLDRSKQNYQNKKRILTALSNMTLVTPSQWLADIVKKSFLSEYPIEVIHNGVDLNLFKPTSSRLKKEYCIENKKVILGVSYNWPLQKRLDLMVRLAQELIDDYQVVLIGLTKKQIKMLPQNVIGLEKTNNVMELVAWYSAADVYVNPTMEDNYPTVNLEAQACGTPVVTFQSGGSPECIKENYGVAVARGDYDALKQAVIQTCNLKKQGYVPYVESIEDFVDAYLKVYNNVLSNQR